MTDRPFDRQAAIDAIKAAHARGVNARLANRPQLVLDFETASTEPLKPCQWVSQRLSQDQFRCAQCGVVWDVDEARPACLNTSA